MIEYHFQDYTIQLIKYPFVKCLEQIDQSDWVGFILAEANFDVGPRFPVL